MNKNLTVLCVLQGNYLDRGEEYVFKLREMCRRHLPEHEFFCLTDQLEPWAEQCNKLPMRSDLKGWWAKVELFSLWPLIPGVKVYFDLDVVITGPVHLPDPHDKLLAPDDFSYPIWGNHRRALSADQMRWLGGPGTINSSMMVWRGETGREVWDSYIPECSDIYHGDQNWITACLYPQDKLAPLPRNLVNSFRYNDGIPSPVIAYHGPFKPHDESSYWRGLEV